MTRSPAAERVEESLGEGIRQIVLSEESHLNKKVGELVCDLRVMHETVLSRPGS